MADSRTLYLQNCLDRLRSGDPAAGEQLLAGSCERLAELTHVMLKGYGRLKRWEQTDDVLQNSLVRLHRALHSVVPPTLRDYYRLAGAQIRRELIDLSRHYYGPEGSGRRHATNADGPGTSETPAYDRADTTDSPARLAAWSDFHVQVEKLPDEEREVFDLVWYQGLQKMEAAELLNVSSKTVTRRWHSACLKLHAALGGELPGA